ncbi:MAG: hypothetical protein ISR48_03440 [Alphaproteobacteria bacterium]|nr:hypothetical protein [Alphaproteobacteria bacterium]
MTQMIDVLTFEIWFLIAALAAIVVFKMLSGGINTKGLLCDKQTGTVSPARVQLLLFTVMGAVAYLTQTVGQVQAGGHGFPEVPPELLWLVGGSQALYLGGKSYTKFFK